MSFLLQYFDFWSNRLFLLLSLVVLVSVLSGCVSPPTVINPTPIGEQLTTDKKNSPRPSEYMIQIGDLLDIKFTDSPSLNEMARVRPDGRISLQLIDEIKAAGTSVAELKNIIEKTYSSMYSNLRVTVSVPEYTVGKVFVLGAVEVARAVELNRPLTVLQAVAIANGFTKLAIKSGVVVIRHNHTSGTAIFQVNLEKALDGTDINQDIYLVPDDIVYIPPKSTTFN